MVGWVGDSIEALNLHLYSDADYGGWKSKSTSGIQLMVEGPNTSCPICGASSVQTCVSHSTPEAEIVAGELALRKLGLPAMIMWDILKNGKLDYDIGSSEVVPPTREQASEVGGQEEEK